MKFIVFILILISQNLLAAVDTTKINLNLHLTKYDAVAFGLDIVSGALWGVHEVYYKNNYRFEELGFKNKFYAHNAWENNYVGGQYYDGAKLKSSLWTTFRDVKHFSSRVSFFTLGCSITIKGVQGNKSGKAKTKIAKIILGYTLRSLAAYSTYELLKN